MSETMKANSQSQLEIMGYMMYGAGKEKVIVMHDWMGDSENYRPMMSYLDSAAYTYAFVDVRGYGMSRGLGGPYTVEQVAEDAFALADKLGWERFHVVGHSMTGLVVQYMALQDWKTASLRRLKSVVAITPVSADGYPATAEDIAFFQDVIRDANVAREGFGALAGGRLTAQWGVVKTEKHLQTANPEAMRGYLAMWLNTNISREIEAANIGTPLLLIGGRHDLPGFQESQYQKTFAQWYSNLKMEYVVDAGHHLPQEVPVYAATLIENFLAENS